MTVDSIVARLGQRAACTPRVRVEERVDSTNTRLKELAAAGAPEGTALIALEQTAGRGTHGRAFASPRGEGLYLSMVLRPRGSLAQLFTLTGWAAVAARRAVMGCCAAPVDIKWMNDLYLNGRKLCGILTELAPITPDGRAEWAVVGSGINLAQSRERFRALGLEGIATSLAAEGYPVAGEELAARLIGELDRLRRDFPHGGEPYLAGYREACLNVGRRVSFEEGGRTVTGVVRGIGDDFSLEVEGEDGVGRTVTAGTVQLIQ